MFMGDRWSFPHQASAATYVWMPLQVEGTRITIPEYWQCWDINRVKPVDALRNGKTIPTKKMMPDAAWKEENGRLLSNTKGSVLAVPFQGTHTAVTGESNSHSGYAQDKCAECKERYYLFFISRLLQ